MSENIKVEIKILEQTFTLMSPPGQEMHLRESARLFDESLRTIKASGRVVGLERMAIMAGLNFSAEVLQSKKEMRILADALGQLDAKVLALLNQKS